MSIIDKVSNFILKYNKYKDINLIRKYVEEHFKYRTIDYAVDENNNIIAVVRWNVINEYFNILDFCISEDYRKKGLGCKFIIKGLKYFPDVKYLQFQRGVRGDERIRKLSIDKVLRRNFF